MKRRLSILFLILFALLVSGCRVVSNGNYTLAEGETISGFLLVASGNVTLEPGSQVTGSVFVTSGNLVANGEVGGNILMTSGNISLGQEAVVRGNVTALSGNVLTAPTARIEGETRSSLGGGYTLFALLLLCAVPLGLLLLLALVAAILFGRRPARPVATTVPVVRSAPAFSPDRQAAPFAPEGAQVFEAVDREEPRREQPLGVGSPALAASARTAPAGGGWNPASVLVGLLLIGLGGLFLAAQFLEIDLWGFTWPFLIVLVGLLFFAGMALGGRRSAGLAIPGAIITTVGLILLVQNAFDIFQTWAYAWALIPAAVGLGMMIQGGIDRRPGVSREGRRLAGLGLLIFVIAAAFFELFINLSGFASQSFSAFLWPLLLIGLGLILLLRWIFSFRNR